MSDVAAPTPAEIDVAKPRPARPGRRMHPLPVRIMHWTNALAILIMIGSGMKIYNDEPLFGWLEFPNFITIGGDPDKSDLLHGNAGQSGALQWHFLGMWLVVFNGLAYLIYGIVSGRFRRLLYPIRPREVLDTVRAALRFHLSHDDLTVYNAVQKVLYVGIILVLIIEVLAGLCIWKPMQFSRLAHLFYDFQGARLVHFLGMSAIVAFLAVHVLLALLVPQTLVAMITGGPRLAKPGPAPIPSEPVLPPGE